MFRAGGGRKAQHAHAETETKVGIWYTQHKCEGRGGNERGGKRYGSWVSGERTALGACANSDALRCTAKAQLCKKRALLELHLAPKGGRGDGHLRTPQAAREHISVSGRGLCGSVAPQAVIFWWTEWFFLNEAQCGGRLEHRVDVIRD